MLPQSLKSLPRHYCYIAQSERYGDDIKGIAYAVETVQDRCRSHVEGTHYSPPVGRDPGVESDAYSASNSVPSTALSSTALPDGTTTCPQHSALERQVDPKVGSCQYFAPRSLPGKMRLGKTPRRVLMLRPRLIAARTQAVLTIRIGQIRHSIQSRKMLSGVSTNADARDTRSRTSHGEPMIGNT